MPEVETQQQASTPPGWVAGLPDTLKTNEAFTKFKTVGDFATDYLAVFTKASELEKKTANSIPKLPDDASDEERSAFYDALGRPKQPSEYEFEGEDKNATEWTNQWKQEFHSLGLTKAQAKAMSQKWNGAVQKMVEAHNTLVKNEIATATTKFKSELGDKFDTNVELAKRMWSKYGEGDFDKAFDEASSTSRIPILRMILKFAAATGEDRSPQGGLPNGKGGASAPFMDYSKSPAPPKR